jgi:hypothetical protein
MIQISKIPVGFPAEEANGLRVRILSFQTNSNNCSTYYELCKESKYIDENDIEIISVKILATGNYTLTETQYDNWGSDNSMVEDNVLNYLGLSRL